jgi:hypothetical protein
MNSCACPSRKAGFFVLNVPPQLPRASWTLKYFLYHVCRMQSLLTWLVYRNMWFLSLALKHSVLIRWTNAHGMYCLPAKYQLCTDVLLKHTTQAEGEAKSEIIVTGQLLGKPSRSYGALREGSWVCEVQYTAPQKPPQSLRDLREQSPASFYSTLVLDLLCK